MKIQKWFFNLLSQRPNDKQIKSSIYPVNESEKSCGNTNQQKLNKNQTYFESKVDRARKIIAAQINTSKKKSPQNLKIGTENILRPYNQSLNKSLINNSLKHLEKLPKKYEKFPTVPHPTTKNYKIRGDSPQSEMGKRLAIHLYEKMAKPSFTNTYFKDSKDMKDWNIINLCTPSLSKIQNLWKPILAPSFPNSNRHTFSFQSLNIAKSNRSMNSKVNSRSGSIKLIPKTPKKDRLHSSNKNDSNFFYLSSAKNSIKKNLNAHMGLSSMSSYNSSLNKSSYSPSLNQKLSNDSFHNNYSQKGNKYSSICLKKRIEHNLNEVSKKAFQYKEKLSSNIRKPKKKILQSDSFLERYQKDILKRRMQIQKASIKESFLLKSLEKAQTDIKKPKSSNKFINQSLVLDISNKRNDYYNNNEMKTVEEKEKLGSNKSDSKNINGLMPNDNENQVCKNINDPLLKKGLIESKFQDKDKDLLKNIHNFYSLRNKVFYN